MSQHTEPRNANTSPTMSVDVGGTRFAPRPRQQALRPVQRVSQPSVAAHGVVSRQPV